MFSISTIIVPISNVGDTTISSTHLVGEESIRQYTPNPPTKIGGTRITTKFPNSWDMVIETITKIA